MKRKEAPQGAAAKRSSRLRFSKDETEAAGASASGSGSGNENSAKSEPSDQPRANPNSSATGKDSPQGSKKVQWLEKKSETKHAKLEKAQDKLPTKRKIKLKYRDESTLKVRHKLHFEQEVKSRSEHVKGSMPKRAVKGVSNLGIAHAHKKLYQAEEENVGTKAAHRSELVAETGLRSALHFHKTAPYRKVEKLEHSVQKADIKLAYNKAMEENPQLKSNMFSRMAQKHKIKKDYAQAAREAKKTGSRAKSVATKAKQTGTKAVEFVKRHPKGFLIALILLMLILIISSAFSSCSVMMNGSTGVILSSSYLALDADIDSAELVYTEWETDLLIEVQNAETTHSGYDEYRYSVDEVGHNPYELMSFLTAIYQDFTYSEAESVLQQIFAQQYSLTFTPEVEIRYRTETRTGTSSYTDPDTGETYEESYEYEVQVPYEWHILNVTLTSQRFTSLTLPQMNADQMETYNILMQTKGNRQYLSNTFDFNWLPLVSSYYGFRIHPISGIKNYHRGIDIAVPTGTPVLAGFDGTVTEVGNDAGGYGLYLAVIDKNGVTAKYAHLDEILVTNGQTVSRGDSIAKTGNTGNSTGPHLHLEVIKNGQYLNPIYFAETGDDGSSYIPPGSPGGVIIPDYPGEPITDADFAALMEVAQAQLGKPYVWGAAGPDSFDCSGFVSYVFNQSGVASFGRLTAQGIYNISTPVSRENARPGDIIVFTGTYDSPGPVSHIGIYIGNGMMIHSGKPCQYASIDTSYWREHFYAFARIN